MFNNFQSPQDKGFYTFLNSGPTSWIPFTIPTSYKNIAITAIGAGGAGGSGYAANTLTRAGGGGGGSGGITTVTYPTKFLPETIYIQPGAGGTTSSSSGNATYVSITQSTANAYLLAYASGGSGGTNATSSTAATGGAAGVVATYAGAPYMTMGYATLSAGVAGGVGGSGTNGTPATTSSLSSSILTGGTGGAGMLANTMSFVGGSIIGGDGPLPDVTPSAITFTNTSVGYYAHWFQGNKYVQTTNFESSLTPTTTGNFTMEIWWYPASTSASRHDLINFQGSSGFNRITVYYDGTNLNYDAGTTAAATTRITSAQSITNLAYKWNHVALSRVSGTTSLYLNGTRLGTFADTLTYTAAFKFTTGRDPNGATYVNGMISNFRYLLGTGLYSGTTITVPTSPLTAIANTVLLTVNDSTTIDNGPNALSMTAFNTPRIDGNNPFSASLNNPPQNGIISYRPLCMTGGIGGPSIASGTVPSGGAGAPGCGGGGGGACTAGGAGGAGGSGLVIISLW